MANGEFFDKKTKWIVGVCFIIVTAIVVPTILAYDSLKTVDSVQAVLNDANAAAHMKTDTAIDLLQEAVKQLASNDSAIVVNSKSSDSVLAEELGEINAKQERILNILEDL